MGILKRKIEAIKKILKCDEFFLTTSYTDDSKSTSVGLGPILYEYTYNTNRKVFYHFVKGYINETILRNNGGKYKCYKEYDKNGLHIYEDSIIDVTKDNIIVSIDLVDQFREYYISNEDLEEYFIFLTNE